MVKVFKGEVESEQYEKLIEVNKTAKMITNLRIELNSIIDERREKFGKCEDIELHVFSLEVNL